MAGTKVTSESSPEKKRKASSVEKAVAVPIFFKAKWRERITAMREEIGLGESSSDDEAIHSCFKNAPGLVDPMICPT